MAQRVCPWWIGYLLVSPIRRWIEIRNPEEFLRPYVKPGMTVFEPGPGMGFFTLALAKFVGASGRVIAADIQPRMLEVLRRRATKAGLVSRIETRLVSPNSLGVDELESSIDFVLAWAMVHELPSADKFFAETAATMKRGAMLLFAEPSGHVDAVHFAKEVEAGRLAGLVEIQRVDVPRSSAALLRKEK
jgi:ubiquinone/menaquinone biosynthesis C-methylase UbiE